VASDESEILKSIASIYEAGSRRIREQFDRDHQSATVLRERTHVVDRVVTGLYSQLIAGGPGEPQGLCVAAVGGYGRRELHPCSDVDLTFVCANAAAEAAHRESTAALLRSLWDLGLRSSGGLRTLGECRTVLATDPEFAVALLDVRYLAGDPQLFGALHDRLLPEVIARERNSLVANLDSLTRQRHQKYAGTIFHLEPNIKDAPGGLRDYHVARWLAGIAALDERGAWSAPDELWPQAFSPEARAAFSFLSATRCFLHYRRERDDNHLTYEMQDQSASEGVGSDSGPLSTTEWMRRYFRHARRIDALVSRLLDETSRGRRSLSAVFEDWRTRLSNSDFSVIGGRILPRQPAANADAGMLLKSFEMMARHDLGLSAEAERWIRDVLPRLAPSLNESPEATLSLQEILTSAHAAAALRAMHRLGVLTALVPEFHAIDALVTRDFYHRYTVDEHTFVTIQALHDLEKLKARKGVPAESRNPDLTRIEPRFAALLAEVDRPEVLFLALLLHDLGKGTAHADHVQGSEEAAQRVLARLGTSPDEDRTVLFLIAHHIDMSSTLLRRDILDPDTIREFAHKIGSVERLKLLTLLTYADIKAVNPEALTPWKADALWQLYVSTANDLARSLDDDRVQAGDATLDSALDIDETLTAGRPVDQPSELHAFLAGFPQRYLAVHAPGEILQHLEMARALDREPARLRLEREHAFWQLTLITRDRPLLFATITGALASWGMSIVKAEAFSNAQGVVLDIFAFQDLHRTLELNPSEIARFEQHLLDALAGKLSLNALLADAAERRASLRPPKVTIPMQMRFDDASSSHSTLLELVTADRPGLLFDVSYALAQSNCNIEVALIDTEGQRAIDVFYLTAGAAKLSPAQQDLIRAQLESLLASAAVGARPSLAAVAPVSPPAISEPL
jgi:[protein-PII] uridylyltransferase